MIIEKHIIIADPELSVVATLKNEIELSSIQIKQAIAKGCLWLEKSNKIKRLRRLKTELKVNQQLHFYYNSEVLAQRPLEAQLLEDNDSYSIWVKPSGMLSQGSKWGDHTTIYRYAEQMLTPQRQGIIVHRLDKMTSGLMILAHHRKTAAAFTQLFEQRKIKKCYRAKLNGLLEEALNDEIILDSPLDDKPAFSRVKTLQTDPTLNQSLVNICIETGRKHQIRQHLAQLGYPLVGDRLYGNDVIDNTQRPDLQLTAYLLEFICPISGENKSYQLNDEQCPLLS